MVSTIDHNQSQSITATINDQQQIALENGAYIERINNQQGVQMFLLGLDKSKIAT